MSGVHITLADDPGSCRAIEDLQRDVWGQPPRALVPAEQVRAVVHNGGMLLLAHDDDGDLIGFCYAFVGVEDRRPILCSHMLAVLPVARGRGVGRALKLAQREVARERGFDKITWTFDPLQAGNAYLNLHRLGAYARRYFVDHYGAMDDDINRGMPTDRLLAEWPVSGDPRARASASEPVGGDPRARASASEPARHWLLPARSEGGLPHPGEPALDEVRGAGGLVAVPSDVDALRRSGTDVHLRWRLALRTTFQEAFAAGLVAVDVDRDAGSGIAAYMLERTQ